MVAAYYWNCGYLVPRLSHLLYALQVYLAVKDDKAYSEIGDNLEHLPIHNN